MRKGWSRTSTRCTRSARLARLSSAARGARDGGNRDPTLLKEIRRAHRCFEALVSGRVRSVAELATAEGISDRYVSALLPLAMLAPNILDAIAAGRQPPELTAHRLIRTMDLPIAWAAQEPLGSASRESTGTRPVEATV